MESYYVVHTSLRAEFEDELYPLKKNEEGERPHMLQDWEKTEQNPAPP